MKILYDHQIFQAQRYGGISRYFYELMAHKDKNIDVELALRFHKNEYLHQGKEAFAKRPTYIPNRYYKLFKTPLRKANERHSLDRLKHSDAEVFHPTFFDPFVLSHIGNKKMVLTVHDMIFELFLKDHTLHIEEKRKMILAADRIIAISECTKKDLLELLPVDENRIDVVYHGVRPLDISTYQTPLILPERYILFVGARQGYKNFNLLIQAFAQITQKDKDLRLICTGAPFKEAELKQLKDLGISDKVKLYSVNDYDLAMLYQKAQAFIFPSLYEGFGLPILEAFSYECPTLLAQASCFPEIAEDAALYFDPKSVESLTSELLRLLASPSERESLIAKGKERVRKFTWEQTANETFACYQR